MLFYCHCSLLWINLCSLARLVRDSCVELWPPTHWDPWWTGVPSRVRTYIGATNRLLKYRRVQHSTHDSWLAGNRVNLGLKKTGPQHLVFGAQGQCEDPLDATANRQRRESCGEQPATSEDKSGKRQGVASW